LKETPNKAIANLLLSNSAKKRKPSDDLAATESKEHKGDTSAEDVAAAIDKDTTST